MLDLEEVREKDIANGIFDIYTDDIDFTEDQYVELRMRDKIRISSINPVDIENPEIFEHIKRVTDYIKRVADAVCPEGYRVIDNKIISYVKVILRAVNNDISCLENVSEDLFKENYLLEGILYRDLVVQSNKIKNEQGEEEVDEGQELQKLYQKFKQIEEIINRKKYNQKVFSNNLVAKRIGEKTGLKIDGTDVKTLSNDALLSKITGDDEY